MMQSIVLTKPSSSATGESIQGTAKGKQSLDLDNTPAEKIPTNKFSGVFDEAIELPNKTGMKTNTMTKQFLPKMVLSEEKDGISTASFNMQSEVDKSKSRNSVQSGQIDSELSASKAQRSSSIPVEDAPMPLSSSGNAIGTNEDPDSSNLLDRIQAAQNIDTHFSATVNVLKSSPQINSALTTSNSESQVSVNPTVEASLVKDDGHHMPLNTLEVNPMINIADQRLKTQGHHDVVNDPSKFDDSLFIGSKREMQSVEVPVDNDFASLAVNMASGTQSDLVDIDSAKDESVIMNTDTSKTALFQVQSVIPNMDVSVDEIQPRAVAKASVNADVAVDDIPTQVVAPMVSADKETSIDYVQFQSATSTSRSSTDFSVDDAQAQAQAVALRGDDNSDALVDDIQAQSISSRIVTNATIEGTTKNINDELVNVDPMVAVSTPVTNSIESEQDDLAEINLLTSTDSSEVPVELAVNRNVTSTNVAPTQVVNESDVQSLNANKAAQSTVGNTQNIRSKLAGEKAVNNINTSPAPGSIETHTATEKIKQPDSITSTPVFDKQMDGGVLTHLESEKAPVNHLGDGFGARISDINSMVPNKLDNQPLQSATTQTTLQQSLDLQAKHSAALIGERVLMMINQGKQEIHIRLDPAELGSMHIKLHMHQDQLNMSIQTDASQSKDIIEQNLPKLREQLAQQGVNLGNTSVEQNPRGQQQNQQNTNQQGQGSSQHSANASTSNHFSSENDEKIIAGTIKIPLSAQGIDYYA